MDTSRSGLIFHPRVVGWMPRWIAANSILVLLQGALEPLSAWRPARRILGLVRGALAASLGLLG